MPTPGPRVTTTEVIDWNARYTDGESLRSIANSCGRSPHTVREHLYNYQPPTEGTAGRHLAPSQRAEIWRLYARGHTPTEIAGKLGHRYDTVTRTIRVDRNEPEFIAANGLAETAVEQLAQTILERSNGGIHLKLIAAGTVLMVGCRPYEPDEAADLYAEHINKPGGTR